VTSEAIQPSRPAPRSRGATGRAGDETRSQILDVALRLFTERGYEGTSIRDLADALGMTKSALYYHFPSKEAIVMAVVDQRRGELDELKTWVSAQPRTPDLLQRTALRWIDSTTPQRLQGLRFAHANGPVMARLARQQQTSFRDWFHDIVTLALPADASVTDRLIGLMALDTVSSAMFAARNSTAQTEDILAAARTATISLTS
jgi:AcrR family transcriptional regulator